MEKKKQERLDILLEQQEQELNKAEEHELIQEMIDLHKTEEQPEQQGKQETPESHETKEQVEQVQKPAEQAEQQGGQEKHGSYEKKEQVEQVQEPAEQTEQQEKPELVEQPEQVQLQQEPAEEQRQEEQAEQQEKPETKEQSRWIPLNIPPLLEILVIFRCGKCKREIEQIIKPEDLHKARKFKKKHKLFEGIECDGIVTFHKLKLNEEPISIFNTAEYFHDGSTPYMRYEQNGHREIHQMDKEFKEHFVYLYRKQYGPVSLKESVEFFRIQKAKTIYEGVEHKLYPRVAWHDDAIWYDLTNEDWLAVKITADGWDIQEPPILFKRFPHQQPQETPEKGTDGKYIYKLFDIIRLKNKDDELLFIVSLISKYVPGIPHPIDVTFGPQGSSKSFIDRKKKSLVDPSQIKVSAMPKRAELIQMASHHWYLPFDNLSEVKPWESDALCRISTGEGVSKRALYTNDKDFVYSYCHCTSLNGINNPVCKSDLLDRCILFELELLPEEKRKSERVIEQEFKEMKAKVLGSIFDILSRAMMLKQNITHEKYPRMADFMEWGFSIAEAMEPGGGKKFLEVFYANIKEKTLDVVQGDITGESIRRFMEEPDNRNQGFVGTMTNLYEQLWSRLGSLGVAYDQEQFPKNAVALGKRINEILVNLRAEGIHIEKYRDRRGNSDKVERLVRITYVPVGTD